MRETLKRVSPSNFRLGFLDFRLGFLDKTIDKETVLCYNLACV